MQKLIIIGVLMCAATATAQSWMGDYYRLRMQKESPQWTIHGLWPEWTSSGFCRNVTWNEAAITPILPQLTKDWPSDMGSDTTFWKHEWEKHGSCADHMDEFTYFNTTLSLYTQSHSLCPHAGSSTQCNICFARHTFKRCECTENGIGDCPKN
eukprot:TRINITY_DN2928_c0_g1_i2.p1 TRINITY_DN2928_c0_g1~~TRINITY_DN2928_c0_g1_i2.p1  ORF type:complete len:153 (+),score=18.74 TRINITY_DN2928_c0_g1_i2:58-516(+)